MPTREWLLALARANPPAPDGFAPAIHIIDDRAEAGTFDSWSADTEDLVKTGRVRLMTGATAIETFRQSLEDRLTLAIEGPVLACEGREGSAGTISDALARARGRQREELNWLIGLNQATYARKSLEDWSRRFARQEAPPLRVLIPTTRHATFVGHAAGDLAKALQELGADVRILQEPNRYERLTSLAYARIVHDFEPDLIVLINYARKHLAPGVPDGVPVITWIQDAMGHLFDASVAVSMGRLDFVAGHLHAALFDSFGYPRQRSLYLPVVASEQKFHAGSVSRAHRDRYACEIACVTHHSETPDQLRTKLLALARGNPVFQSVIDELIEEAHRLVEAIEREPFTEGMRRAISRALGSRELTQDEAQVSMLYHQVCAPIGDRLIRHQTLRWAADLAREHGWRLHIHGAGWEDHRALGAFARGPVEHGEDLRACYQGAAVHLHASINWNLHQRVLECALSGGLPLCRLKHSDIELLACDAKARCVQGRRDRGDTDLARPVPAIEHRSSMALVAQLQRLSPEFVARHAEVDGQSGLLALSERFCDDPWSFVGGWPAEREMTGLLGDLSESCFTTRADLGALIERAISRPAWRENVSEGIRRRTRAHLTCERAAGRLIQLVREGLVEGFGTSIRACA